MSKHDSFFCNNCREKTLHIKKTPNHILHLLLSIFTAGLWLIVWFLIVVSSAGASWRCSKCGTSITGIALAETKSDTKDCPMCAETIKAAAQICRFCGHIFEPAVVKEEIKEFRETPDETKKTSKFSPVLVVLVLGLGIIGLIKLLRFKS